MNLRPECTTPINDQLLEAFAYAINWRDLHDEAARRYANDATRGGQTCECEDEDFEDDGDHECADNLLNAEHCMAQAQLAVGLAQAAANAALAAATLLAKRS